MTIPDPSVDSDHKMDHKTVFGGFRVDQDGSQIGHKDADAPVAGRQEGELKVIVHGTAK